MTTLGGVDMQKFPPLLPGDVARVLPNGLPSEQLVDFETLQDSFYRRSLTSISVTIGDVSAGLTTEITVRANADSALASSVTSLSATVGSVSASLTTEISTRASADSAIVSSVSTLSATVGSNTAAISNEVTARTSADSALASSISSLTSTVNGNTAAIGSEATARANADSALASSLSSLSTTVGGHTSALSTYGTSIDGISAQYVLKATLDGVSGGYNFVGAQKADGTGPVFTVTFDANVVVNGSLIVNGSITTTKVASGAITYPDAKVLPSQYRVAASGTRSTPTAGGVAMSSSFALDEAGFVRLTFVGTLLSTTSAGATVGTTNGYFVVNGATPDGIFGSFSSGAADGIDRASGKFYVFYEAIFLAGSHTVSIGINASDGTAMGVGGGSRFTVLANRR